MHGIIQLYIFIYHVKNIYDLEYLSNFNAQEIIKHSTIVKYLVKLITFYELYFLKTTN